MEKPIQNQTMLERGTNHGAGGPRMKKRVKTKSTNTNAAPETAALLSLVLRVVSRTNLR
jgi:hypothetical protein